MNKQFEVRIHYNRKFTVLEDTFESIQEAVEDLKVTKNGTPDSITLNHMLLTVPELKIWYKDINPDMWIDKLLVINVRSFHQSKLNTHTFYNIPEAIEFLKNQPIGQITSTIISVTGLTVGVGGLSKWFKIMEERKG